MRIVLCCKEKEKFSDLEAIAFRNWRMEEVVWWCCSLRRACLRLRCEQACYSPRSNCHSRLAAQLSRVARLANHEHRKGDEPHHKVLVER